MFKEFGIETPHKFDREKVRQALDHLANDEKFDNVLRAKGIIEDTDGKWIYFDMVPGDYEIRDGEPDYTGRLVVIGTDVDEGEMRKLFGME